MSSLSALTETTEIITRELDFILVEGIGGPKGDKGDPGAGGAAVFVLDVTSSSGIVGNKVHPATIPVNRVVSSCLSDANSVRIHVGLSGGSDSYSPECSVGGVPAVLSETATRRWFEGYADVVLVPGINKFLVEADSGATTMVTVTLAGAGPEIISCSFGDYPSGQTSLKAGDSLSFFLMTDPDATSVTLLASGASSVPRTFPVVGGLVTGVLSLGTGSGVQHFSFKAQNLLGTFGGVFDTTVVFLDQVAPSFGAFSVAYPDSHLGLGVGESATVSCPVVGADSVTYSSVGMSVADPTELSTTKVVTNTSTGYVGSGANYTITARKSSNGSVSVKTGLVAIATVAPSASISVVPAGRLASSPLGLPYEVRITPSQMLLNAPTLVAGAGVWSGSWVLSGTFWKRTLLISDADERGIKSFAGMDLVGLSGIHGSVISSGSSFEVGGFSSRVVTFPAFSRVAPLGVHVADRTKTSAQVVGGNTLVRHDDNGAYSNGYYIANADGSYNPTGAYIGLSDAAFAGSNTSGTLQVSVSEAA